MTSPTIGVLALQGDVREHALALADAGALARPIRRPEELDGIQGLVVPGGESTTMSKLAVTFGLVEPLRARLAQGLPAYGSCAGMIMLADEILDGRPDQRTFGGLDVVVRRNAFGRQNESFEADVDFPAVGAAPVHGVFIRAPWVEKIGPGTQVLATLAADPYGGRVVAVRQGNVLATSFHPELTGDRRVHAYFTELVRAAA